MNIVFASGFSFPQHLGIIDYFDGVAARFEGKHNTLFPPVQPFGRSKDRAQQLADAIAKEKFPPGPIHVIAHSMAGLDSRYLIDANLHGLSELGRIATLTTLSTPHAGSPVADLLLGSMFSRLLHRGVTLSIGALGLIGTGALKDLTTEGARQVPDVAKSHRHISYHSYAATGRGGGKPTSAAFRATHDYIGNNGGPLNDGLVASDSSEYGEFQGTVPCDHADLVGHDLDFGVTGFQPIHLALYEDIIRGLPARIKP